MNQKDEIFNPEIINKDNDILKKEIDEFLINRTQINKPISLIASFYKEPIFSTKEKIADNENNWHFNNIYNNYFCFCKGSQCLENINEKCKYLFYLNIIDKNRYLYNKTDYLLADFFYSFKSAEHTFPVFKEMIKQNLSAHYMTAKDDIFKEFCENEINCLKIIKVSDKNVFINGDFLEKYLELMLKLKSVIAGSLFYSYTHIFYDIEYITYISAGHGVSYFKHYLYKKYLGCKYYNKIVIPPNNIFIDIAKRYGWKDENIIRNGIPKWDEYIEYEEKLIKKEIKEEKSIFVMFTWREMKQDKKISDYYINNILKFIKDKRLKNLLIEKNILLYFSFHHKMNFVAKSKTQKLYKPLDQDHISDALQKSSLIISDFSSVIFELIYRKKPIVLYIPDGEDPNIEEIYDQGYYDIINGLKNGTTYFENIFFDFEKAMSKVIYYIQSDFQLDDNLIRFYEKLGLNTTNNTKTFVEYLKNLK